eukprot:844151_1
MTTLQKQENKGLKLLIKIMDKIEGAPQCARYRSLNLQRISRKLTTSHLNVLMCCGFSKSENGDRLLFDETQLENLSLLRQLLLTHSVDDLSDLLASGFDLHQINNAMQKSGHTEQEKQETGNDMDEPKKNALQRLLDMGFKPHAATVALEQTDDDINLAVQYLSNTQHVVDANRKNRVCERHFGIPLVEVGQSYNNTSQESLERMKQEMTKIALQAMKEKIAMARYEPKRIITSCTEHITECKYLTMLKQTLSSDETNEEDELQMFDSYCHLLRDHPTDLDYEYIYKTLGGRCDVETCNMFARNYRNRSVHSGDKPLNARDETKRTSQQIRDKIHCCFRHCYDFAFRLSSKQREYLEADMDDYKEDETNQSISQFVINRNTARTIEIVSEQRQRLLVNNESKISEEISRYQNNVNTKFNQLPLGDYSAGIEFKYDDDDELDEFSIHGEQMCMQVHAYTMIKAKYRTFKEELMQNPIAALSLEQWISECSKSKIHFNSLYRKQHYPSIPSHCILALIIYCNYTELQYKFTKTYREDMHLHNNFFYLGKYLKVSLSFGTKLRNKKVYHGISDKLLFRVTTCDFYVHGPLSTTLSFDIAVGFAGGENGLVIEFTGEHPRYFPVYWLSDFANERECLFVQNAHPFIVSNIIECVSSFEHKLLLQAVRCIIHCIADPNSISYKEQHMFHITHELTHIIEALIYHQLSLTFEEYASINLPQYAQNLLNFNLSSKYDGYIDFANINPFWRPIFVCNDCEWIKMDLLSALFPNIDEITVLHNNLCSVTMDTILAQLRMSSSVKKIRIRPKRNCRLSISKAIDVYSGEFNEIGLYLNRHHIECDSDDDEEYEINEEGKCVRAYYYKELKISPSNDVQKEHSHYWYCPCCDETFKYSLQKSEHMQSVHNMDSTKFIFDKMQNDEKFKGFLDEIIQGARIIEGEKRVAEIDSLGMGFDVDLIRKALTETHNAETNLVVDYILAIVKAKDFIEKIMLCITRSIQSESALDEMEFDEMLCAGFTALIIHRLSEKTDQYGHQRARLFSDDYMKPIIDDCLCKQYEAYIDLEMTAVRFILSELIYKECDWIKMNALTILFPNLNRLIVINACLCDWTMNNILDYLDKSTSLLKQIEIRPNTKSELKIVECISRYQAAFNKLSFCLNHQNNELVLTATSKLF